MSDAEQWLQTFGPTGFQSSGTGTSTNTAHHEPLERAARCYAQAGWGDDACRIFEQLGQSRQAAPYHEQQGRWQWAARAYQQAGDLEQAAECYLKDDCPEEAAQCLLSVKKTLQAAWIWANHTQRTLHAQTLAQQFQPESEQDRLGQTLVLARSHVSTAPQQAARGLLEGIKGLRDWPYDFIREAYEAWAFEIAEALQRPDLQAQLHAAAVLAEVPEAHERWQNWAHHVWGNSSGIPNSTDQ